MDGYRHTHERLTEEDRTLLLRMAQAQEFLLRRAGCPESGSVLSELGSARIKYSQVHWPFGATDRDAVLADVVEGEEEELDPFVVQEADKPTSDRAVSWRWDTVARIESRNEGSRTMLFFKSGGSCTVPMPFMEARAWFTGKKSGSFGEHIS